MTDGKRARPLPEVVAPEPGPWTVLHEPSGGHASPEQRVFSAPLTADAWARAVRVHELAHCRWSPARPDPEAHGVSLAALLAAEDARVNDLARGAGLGSVLSALDHPRRVTTDARKDLRAAALLLTSTWASGAWERLCREHRRQGDAGRIAVSVAERAVALLREAPDKSFATAVAVARLLDRLLGREDARDARLGLARLAAAARSGAGDCTLPGATRSGSKRAPRWGDLREVEQPPRVLRSPGRPVRRQAHAEEGTVLRAPHRLLIDRRIWARPLRLPGGAVLVDFSGSTGFTPEDVLELLDAAAGATIACYDGVRAGWGAIRILAHGGRRVLDDFVARPTGGGGNVIDGPALRDWLAPQPPPRVWLSDGHVTGVGDRPSPLLAAEALATCREFSIRRVGSVREAARALSAGARGRRLRRSPAEPRRR